MEFRERGDDGMSTTPKTKRCEHCGKRINVKYRTCPFCAGSIKDRLVPRPAVCPRCKVPLKIHIPHDDREEYDICARCGGLWLDRAEFHRATRKRNVYRHTEKKGEYLRGPLRDPLRYIPCVRCGKVMNRKNFARISGVIIDECRWHGIWLDSGELEKIRHFIADGGLERSRDREIEKVRVELKELATKVNQVGFTHKLIHFWNPKRWLFSGFR
ncbi:MAG: zf-TFIIB domain-containing protein [Candidatus Methylomirabilales bacterium]